MNNVCVIFTEDNENKKTNPIFLEKICFKPMIEYVIQVCSKYTNSKPVIYTNDTDKLTQYSDNALLISDISDITNHSNVDYFIIINAASPLVTEEVFEYGISHLKVNNSDAVFIGEGVTIVSSNQVHHFLDFITTSKNKSNDFAIVSDKYLTETMVCDDKIKIADADKYMRLNINTKLIKRGVTIIDPERTYIQDGILIGENTTIYPGTMLRGNTTIGCNCEIQSNCSIVNSMIGDNVIIKYSVIEESFVDDLTTIGPFAFVRPKSIIGKNVKIGDFVEIKKSKIGNETKISHLTYVGDAIMGENVNFGCGTIVVNYDGINKHKAEIDDNVFIGCNSNLISPIRIGNSAFIAAGSTITDDVPSNGFAIARQRQTNKEGWVKPQDR